jgi:lysophospholipase L1-like esterase
MLKKAIFGLVFMAFATAGFAQTPPNFVALGDSLGEGVQSADADTATQPHGYLALFAQQMDAAFPLPLIDSGPLGVVGSTSERSRQDPTSLVSNLAVSGATSSSILSDSAGQPIIDETDLVEAPRTGTQIQIAQQLQAPFTICWIGNNDVLGTALSFDHLDGSQITPLPVFEANFQAIVSGLTGWNDKVLFANLPDVTQIGFLFSPQDLKLFLGSSYSLPDGSYTTLPTMLLIRMGLVPPSILRDPNWVLDANEVQQIQDATAAFNQVIAQDAAAVNMPVVDIHGLLNIFAQHPPMIGDIPLLLRYNGGIFSLDGVHPSDTGYALVANAFIRKADSYWDMSIPPLSQEQLLKIAQRDPFIDFNGNLVVRGRPFNGLLETLGPILGISGDGRLVGSKPGIHPELGREFMHDYFLATGQNPDRAWTTHDAIEAMHYIFGLHQGSPD